MLYSHATHFYTTGVGEMLISYELKFALYRPTLFIDHIKLLKFILYVLLIGPSMNFSQREW